MALPQVIEYLRHTESERNEVRRLLRTGNHSQKRRARILLDDILNKPSSTADLSAGGVEQAIKTGEWMRARGVKYSRYYVSSHIRAKKTAGLLRMPNADWEVINGIRERSSGIMEDMTPHQRAEYLKKWRNQMHVLDLFNLRPDRGNSFADMADINWPLFLLYLEQECRSKDKVLVVNHGDNMWAARCFHERWTPQDFVQNRGEESYIKIPNGMVLGYTRVNPKTGQMLKNYGWFRTYCPWMGEEPTERIGDGPGDWQPIVRRKYSCDDLLDQVNQQLEMVRRMMQKSTRLKKVA